MSGLFLFLYMVAIGEKINSWFRSPEHNKEVGGKPNSKHQFGGAVDVALDFEKRRPDSAKRLRSLGYEFVPEPNKNHLHIETNGKVESFFRFMLFYANAWDVADWSKPEEALNSLANQFEQYEKIQKEIHS